MPSMRMIGAVEVVATLLTVANAYYKKEQQFFPMCVYLLKSNLSMLVLASFIVYTMVLGAYVLKKIIFGELRIIEAEHLNEFGWMTVSEMFLATTIFRDELDVKFVLVFTAMLLFKGFHWITRDRVEYMEQTLQLPPFFNGRVLTALYMLVVVDVLGLVHAVQSVLRSGPSMAILFANEFSLMLIALAATGVRYAVNLHDVVRGSPWEHRSVFLFYSDFVVDALKLVVYSVFFVVVMMYYGLPLHIIRDLFLTVRSFVARIHDILRYRQATYNMQHLYPTVGPAQMADTDRICIICREEMHEAKRLPCGHNFHFRCLRSWLERQQACPTCRRPVLDQPPPADQPPPGPVVVPPVPTLGSSAGLPPGTSANLTGLVNRAQVHFNHIGAVPVILIPPEQIAVVPPAREAREPVAAAPESASEPTYVLRQTIPGQPPIYLEPIEFAPGSASRVQVEVHSQHLTDAELAAFQGHTRAHHRAQLEILAQMQLELGELVERMRVAEQSLVRSESEQVRTMARQLSQSVDRLRQSDGGGEGDEGPSGGVGQ